MTLPTCWRNKTLLAAVSALLVLTLSVACGSSSSKGLPQEGDTLALRHAAKLTIVSHEGYTEVTLDDPWNSGRLLHRYLLVPEASKQLPSPMPEGTVIRTPLRRSIITTSVHCGLLDQLGCRQAIAGVCDLQYIHLPWVQQQVARGKVKNCGSALQPTLETIIELQPDAIFLSPFQNSGGYGRVEQLGVPIIEMADYMETSALGRAEWMRFYGLLFGVGERADSLFADVEHRYDSLSSLISPLSSTPPSGGRGASPRGRGASPSVLMDKQTGSVWYVPGGESTIGRMIREAGGSYPWTDNDQSGSLPLPFESVLEKGRDCDVWLFRYNGPQPITCRELLAEKPAYRQFRAFQRGEVYGCNTATSTFYEDTPFHPDLLLRDFITILHPSLGLGQPHYFLKLK